VRGAAPLQINILADTFNPAQRKDLLEAINKAIKSITD